MSNCIKKPQNDVVKPKNDAIDLISRQDAIKTVGDWMVKEFGYLDLNKGERLIDALEARPSAQPEWLTDDDFETIRIHLNACKEKLCNQKRWEEAEEYQRIIDRFMSFASAQPGWIPVTERLPEEKDAGILKKLGIKKRSEHVIATAEVKGERMTVTACTNDGKWDWKMKYAFPDFKVVAWMPLPAPYKGGE